MLVSPFPPPDAEARIRNIKARAHEAGVNTRRQHTQSQALLRRFTRPAPGNKWQLLLFDLRGERVHYKLASPKGCGWVADFVPYASASLEDHWSRVENGFHAAFAAVDDGTLFADPGLVSAVRDMVALHFVRSPLMKRVHDATFRAGQERSRAGLRRQPWEAQRIYQRATGIHTAGEQQLDYIIAQLLREPAELAASGALLRERLVDMYAKVRAVLDAFAVEVLTSESGQLLIGDSPVVNINPGNTASGGVGLLDDDVFLLPIGPEHLVRMHRGTRSGYRAIGADKVDEINTLQIQQAHEYVAAHPDSGLHAFVDAGPRPLMIIGRCSDSAIHGDHGRSRRWGHRARLNRCADGRGLGDGGPRRQGVRRNET